MMSTDPDVNRGYYGPGKGTLSGFDTVEFPTGKIDLTKVGWSIENLRAFLLNESGANFPSQEQIAAINQKIVQHLTDFGNPHKVTLDQLDGNFVLEILGAAAPGTAPDFPPFYSYEAVAGLPLGDIHPSQFTSTNLYRMNEGGVLVVPSSESEIFGTDYVNNSPGIPLFSNVTNVVQADWATRPNITINTSMVTVPQKPGLPFTVYQVSETSATGSFGVKVAVTESLSTVYSFDIFLVPSVNGGKVVLTQPTDPSNSMTVDLGTGDFVLSSSNVLGDTYVYPSGIIRVAFSFTSGNPTADGFVQLLHQNVGDNTTIRDGQAGRPLFQFFGPIASTSTINQPIPVDPTQVAGTGQLLLRLDKVPAPATLTSLMVTLKLRLYPTLPGSVSPENSVFSMGTLTVTRDRTNLYVKSGGTTIFTSAILNGLNVISISYSPTTMAFKDLIGARQSVNGTYPALSTAGATCGCFAGYLESLAIYSRSDRAHSLEFLNNG